MFKKVLVANRGEIAVRVIHACRDLGIPVVALYDQADLGSLHVRLAEECVPLPSARGYFDQQGILQAALRVGADAIHPGYGFLAEQPTFIRACAEAGVTFIGPPADVVEALHNKVAMLDRARAAGFTTSAYAALQPDDWRPDQLQAIAEPLGYPVMVKPHGGGMGGGVRIATAPDELADAVWQTRTASRLVFDDDQVYLERAILPAHYIEVQVLGDRHGNLIHLGERQASVQWRNQRSVEEAPAPCLSQAQREEVWSQALRLARLFGCQNACTVEFLFDADENFYFTEIKPRIQIEHPVTEMIFGIDIVQEQLRIAAGQPLRWSQEQVRPHGWSMLCRVTTEDPWEGFLPSAGQLRRVRLPRGPHVRVDTYAYSGCTIPAQYDPTLAKVVVWGEDREACLRRMRRSLEDFSVIGVSTDVSLLRRILDDPGLGLVSSGSLGVLREWLQSEPKADQEVEAGTQTDAALRDLAVAAAVAYVRRTIQPRPTTPERVRSGWHRDSRRLPS